MPGRIDAHDGVIAAIGVGIFYNDIAVRVKQGNDISLGILAINIGILTVDNTAKPCMIVKEGQAVAFGNEVAVAIVGKESGLTQLAVVLARDAALRVLNSSGVLTPLAKNGARGQKNTSVLQKRKNEKN